MRLFILCVFGLLAVASVRAQAVDFSSNHAAQPVNMDAGSVTFDDATPTNYTVSSPLVMTHGLGSTATLVLELGTNGYHFDLTAGAGMFEVDTPTKRIELRGGILTGTDGCVVKGPVEEVVFTGGVVFTTGPLLCMHVSRLEMAGTHFSTTTLTAMAQ
jgi:hypothetical protein